MVAQIDVLADKEAAFARLIGVDLEAPESPGPHTQRCAYRFRCLQIVMPSALYLSLL